MRPELYGQAVNKIILKCSFSYYDHVCCKCNYVIADEKLKLRQKELYPKLLTMLPNKRLKRMDIIFEIALSLDHSEQILEK